MPGQQINKTFVNMVNRSLNFWATKLDCEEWEAVRIIYRERHNIIRTGEVALKFPDLWKIASNLIYNHRFHIKYSGVFHDWFEILEKSIEIGLSSKDSKINAELYLVQGDFHRELYQLQSAISSSKQAVKFAYRSKEQILIGQCLYYLGQAYRFDHDFKRAIKLGYKALKYFEQNKQDFWSGHAWNLIGGALMERGDFDEAENCLLRGKAIKAMKQSNMGYAVLLITLSQCYMFKENYGESLTLLHGAIEIIEDLGYKRYLSAAYTELGELYYRMGDYDAAEQAYDNVIIEVFRESGDWFREALVLHNLGTVGIKRRKLLMAQNFFEDAIQIWRNQDQSIRLASSLSQLGIIFLLVDNKDLAKESFCEAKKLIPPKNNSVLANEIRERIRRAI